MNISPDEKRPSHANICLDLHRKGAPQFLVARISDALSKGITHFKLRVKSGREACYPNICVPIAGIIEHFRANDGCSFIPAASWRNASVLNQSGTIHPYIHNPLATPSTYFNKVWKFNRDDHHAVVQGIIESARRAGEMSQGVLQGFELALYEVTDNTLLHSQVHPDSAEAVGYVMAQYHKAHRCIVVAVFDLGQGIPASLGKSGFHCSSHAEALAAAVQQGVGDGCGAGNGLWMMERIVSHSRGSFELTSDGARYAVRHHSNSETPKPSFSSVSSFKEGTTLVDFQLHTNQPLDIPSFLNYEPVNLWVDNHTVDFALSSSSSREVLLVSVARESRGCASRYEAKTFATMIGNLMESSLNLCVLDFSDIPLVSASFADELLLRLIERFGITTVIQRISFHNLSATNMAMFDHCFQQRLFDDNR